MNYKVLNDVSDTVNLFEYGLWVSVKAGLASSQISRDSTIHWLLSNGFINWSPFTYQLQNTATLYISFKPDLLLEIEKGNVLLQATLNDN